MDRLTAPIVEAALKRAGASKVFLREKPLGRVAGLFAFFVYRDVAQVWRIRGDGSVQNFEKDVERELAIDDLR